MRKKLILILVFLAAATGVGIYASTSGSMFITDRDMLVRALVYGIVLGGARAVIRDEPKIADGNVTSHDAASFLEHWGTAVGIFILIASGMIIGFFSFSLAKTQDTIAFTTNLHFVGLTITLFCGFFFATDQILSKGYKNLIPNTKDIIHGTLGKYLLRRKWHAEGKYLSSQKSAFLAFVFIGAFVLITGVIKVSAYVWPNVVIREETIYKTATFIHDLSALLFIILVITHVLFVVGLRHWLMLKSWVTGKIPEERAKDEHPIWYEELKKGE